MNGEARAASARLSIGRSFRWLVVATAVMTFILIVVGGIVRVTGSGLGCPDWPTCYGRWIPPLRYDALIEYSHRLAASLTSPLILLTAVVAWMRHRDASQVTRPLMLSVALLVLQILLGGLTVLFELPPVIVAAHLGIALLILAALVAAATSAVYLARAGGPAVAAWKADPLSRIAVGVAVAVFLVLLSGSVVTASGATTACAGWPLCGGAALPSDPLARLHMLHRLFAALSGGLVFWMFVRAERARQTRPATFVAAAATATLLVAQVFVGALNVLRGFPAVLNGLHIATASAVWAALIVTAALAGLEAASAEAAVPGESETRRLAALDFLALTKPIIVALLLVTTLAAMIVAAGGWPGISLVGWTLLGGALAAGGSGALNQYIDREADRHMQRTQRRPLASGRLIGAEVVAFGLVLCIASFYVLVAFVNLLSALLALAGILYYVLFYSVMLKPTTTQNIVIGGGAGAIPPLVGWAAATGAVSVGAFFLFALVFFWTPPHFWALALVRRSDYARAGVPMLPVVQGETQTRRMILLYTVQVVALTLILPAARVGGWIYVVAAVLLGAGLLAYAFQLWRRGGNRPAWMMYRYSSLYLALIFAAMVVDTLVLR